MSDNSRVWKDFMLEKFEIRTGKFRKVTTCAKCEKPLRQPYVCRTWQTQQMPAPAYYYYHLKCVKSRIHISKLEQLIDVFKATQNKYRKTGADDTEPDSMFQFCLWKASKGRKPLVPTTPEGWDLYSESTKRYEAAQALHDAALPCVNHIRILVPQCWCCYQKPWFLSVIMQKYQFAIDFKC